MKTHSFEEIIKLDQSLQRLALYEVTGGMMVVPKSLEEQFNLELKIAKTFNYFKTMIQKGECTYDFIKWHVLDKNGPFDQSALGTTEINSPDDILDWETENKKLPSKEEVEKQETLRFIKTLMDQVGDDIKIEKIEITPLPDGQNSQPVPPQIMLEDCKSKKKKSTKKNK
jgi:hypothetical protein